MSRINIINADAKDFAIEAVASLPSGTSHEDGRIVKFVESGSVKFYIWHAATTTWVEFANNSSLSSI